MNYSFLNQITYSAYSQASPSTLNINKRIVLKTKKGTSANLKIKFYHLRHISSSYCSSDDFILKSENRNSCDDRTLRRYKQSML